MMINQPLTQQMEFVAFRRTQRNTRELIWQKQASSINMGFPIEHVEPQSSFERSFRNKSINLSWSTLKTAWQIQQIDPKSDDLRFKSANNSTFVHLWRDPLPSQLPLGDPCWRLWNLYNEAIGNWFSIVVPSLNYHIIFTHAIKKYSISVDESHIHPQIYPHFHGFFCGSLLKLHTDLGIPTPRRNSGPTLGTGATFGSPFGKKTSRFPQMPMAIYTGWWYTYPSEKYEFVHGKDYPIYDGKKHAWNQQPDTFICAQKRCCQGCIADQGLCWKWLEYYHHWKKIKHWNDKESVF